MNIRSFILPLVLPLLGAAAPPSANEAASIANEIDQSIAKMRTDLDLISKGYSVSVTTEVGRLERRLREAEIHFLLNDWLRASIVLFDVVDDPSNQGHPRYDACVFLLAESLRKSKSYAGARGFYEEILPRASGERLKDVVLGLLEIASVTNQYGEVDRYIARLRQAGTLSRPDVDYIYGKMLFRGAGQDPSLLARAYETFNGIATGNSISGQASYYAGVSLVQMGRYQEAIVKFQETQSRLRSGSESDELRDLTNLSLGRLYQELGDVAKSADAYQEISQTSKYFPDMLYEVAWAHVNAASADGDPADQKQAFTRALRAIELLMATSPDSRLYPQARILQGNLQIRLGATETAYDTFQSIVDRYGGAQERLTRMVADGGNAKAFFEQLVRADLDRADSTPILPPLAVAWALEEADMGRAVATQGDLLTSQTDIEESRELVETLTAALQGEQRFNIFPGLKIARSKAISVENRVLNLNRRLLNLERRIVFAHIAEPERARIDAAHGRAQGIEDQIQRLPQTTEQVESGRLQMTAAYQEAGRRAYKLSYRVSSMRAQLVAVDTWLRNEGERLTAEERAVVERRIRDARAEVKELDKVLGGLQGEIRKGGALVGGDGGRTHALALRSEFSAVMAEELAMLRQHRSSVPTDLQGALVRLDQQRDALGAVEADLRRLQTGLEQKVQTELVEIERALAIEAQRNQKYDSEHRVLAFESDALLGPVATRTLAEVGRQFRNLVLEADVGIIDVAWARKQSETDKVDVLIREQQERTLELENEFADVLKE